MVNPGATVWRPFWGTLSPSSCLSLCQWVVYLPSRGKKRLHDSFQQWWDNLCTIIFFFPTYWEAAWGPWQKDALRRKSKNYLEKSGLLCFCDEKLLTCRLVFASCKLCGSLVKYTHQAINKTCFSFQSHRQFPQPTHQWMIHWWTLELPLLIHPSSLELLWPLDNSANCGVYTRHATDLRQLAYGTAMITLATRPILLHKEGSGE